MEMNLNRRRRKRRRRPNGRQCLTEVLLWLFFFAEKLFSSFFFDEDSQHFSRTKHIFVAFSSKRRCGPSGSACSLWTILLTNVTSFLCVCIPLLLVQNCKHDKTRRNYRLLINKNKFSVGFLTFICPSEVCENSGMNFFSCQEICFTWFASSDPDAAGHWTIKRWFWPAAETANERDRAPDADQWEASYSEKGAGAVTSHLLGFGWVSLFSSSSVAAASSCRIPHGHVEQVI